MKKFRCSVCGYIHEGDHVCDTCPICGKSSEVFTELKEEDLKDGFACEHEIGAATKNPELVSMLKSCIDGESAEVGMYFAMARQATREGYPEIAEVFKTIAIEEAEHAAIFQELVGDNLEESTALNIKKMISGETGACATRKEIADLAKKLGNDAVHDAVHEAGRDEARHARGLQGLLNRYFTNK